MIALFVEEGPVLHAFLKVARETFWHPPTLASAFIDDGDAEQMRFCHLLGRLHLALDQDGCPPVLLVSLLCADRLLPARQEAIAAALRREVSSRRPDARVRFLNFRATDSESPDFINAAFDLRDVLDEQRYPRLSHSSLPIPTALAEEIDRRLGSLNHSPLGTFELYPGCPLGSKALRLLAFCLLSGAGAERQAFKRLFAAAARQEPMDSGDLELFNGWRSSVARSAKRQQKGPT